MKATYLVVCITLTVAAFSCKKNNDRKTTCRIVTVIESGSATTVYNLTYNNDGKISTVNSSGSTVANKVFTYSGNTVNIITTNGTGAFSSRDSITLDNRGRLANVRSYSDQAGTIWSNTNFEYNGDDLLKYTSTSNSSTSQTVTFTYVNGNMVNFQQGSSSVAVEYFTDKLVQPGDYLEIIGLLQFGRTLYPHKNLTKSLSTGATIANFNYEFNADGQITKFTSTSGSTVSTINYQYQCN